MATEGCALGAEQFAQMLKATEGVTTSLAELEAIGRADLAPNQKALAEACAQFAPETSIEDCVAKASANKPEGGPGQGARAQLAGLEQFLIDKQVVTIPGPEEAPYLNYTMGKLMIRKLRADWTASRGGQAAWREFHDQFLSYGAPSIPMVRKAMLGKDDDGSLF